MHSALGLLLFLAIGGPIPLAQEIIPWNEAGKYYGQFKTVEGTIVATKNTGKVCFLNFSQNWRTDFTAVIFASDFNKFPASPEIYYRNKTVHVTGKIKEYKGKPEVIVKSASQIQILEGNAAPPELNSAPASACPSASMQSGSPTDIRCQVIA